MSHAAVGALSVHPVFLKLQWATKVCISAIQRIESGSGGWCNAGNVLELESKMTFNGCSRHAGSLEDHLQQHLYQSSGQYCLPRSANIVKI